mmetsp:Transcript_27969/g.39046  ORF Transcript_27969/g.39046 Transcript_27969/m.39046 type:complete len:265 (+) Transcript_27969:119-913(+)|eukprot:CAMPEP_0185265502 /NCGR_PEP_ID=MMETSP1359-20130426/27780_1 /TAXON_ID=552665 /ORGANISM="Bigelowiella longifila, Strain CCMP242" /LENGTH=264 /DNA_ID=CAMNT_0027854793 /DNA_START=19 /DNA_END=813 /DNA_ORIENTATION=-
MESKSATEEEKNMEGQSQIGKKTVTILCLGDSLTRGYFMRGYKHHPYSYRLEELLKKREDELEYDIHNQGIDGYKAVDMKDLYTATVKAQLESKKGRKHRREGRAFDIVVILGGINDLCLNTTPEKVFQGLKETHAAAIQDGAITVALTVAEHFQQKTHGASLEKDIAKLNEMIKSLGSSKTHVIDFAAEFPYFSLSEEEKRDLWDDGLHYTPQGYDRMGEIVYAELASAVLGTMLKGGKLHNNNKGSGTENCICDTTRGCKLA